ncbi:hypothetical protein [Mycolicibacterium goodii]|uniref:hypothetical protein n=1 Tax=Mycolicibacterium goodii TaxID=134601 RepID=UPI001BDBD12A|nr:hypothetical protein [Mycolicibacterium goodii]MBU8833584.1 hypothetical protein [Mycolicibacterium goodii]
MSSLFNPQLWANLGISTLALIGCVLFVVALLREWIVIGKAHRAEIARLDARAEKDAESIATLSRAVTEQKATDAATARIIASLREVIDRRTRDTAAADASGSDG